MNTNNFLEQKKLETTVFSNNMFVIISMYVVFKKRNYKSVSLMFKKGRRKRKLMMVSI